MLNIRAKDEDSEVALELAKYISPLMAYNIKRSGPAFSTCIEIFTSKQIHTADNYHQQMGREKADVCNQTFHCDFCFLSYVVSLFM